jgi:hypothetical protein
MIVNLLNWQVMITLVLYCTVPRLRVVDIHFRDNLLRLFTYEHSILNKNYPEITKTTFYSAH